MKFILNFRIQDVVASYNTIALLAELGPQNKHEEIPINVLPENLPFCDIFKPLLQRLNTLQ